MIMTTAKMAYRRIFIWNQAATRVVSKSGNYDPAPVGGR